MDVGEYISIIIWIIIAVVIRKINLIMVCDGSYQPNLDDNREAATWGVHCIDTDRFAWLSLPTTLQVVN